MLSPNAMTFLDGVGERTKKLWYNGKLHVHPLSDVILSYGIF